MLFPESAVNISHFPFIFKIPFSHISISILRLCVARRDIWTARAGEPFYERHMIHPMQSRVLCVFMALKRGVVAPNTRSQKSITHFVCCTRRDRSRLAGSQYHLTLHQSLSLYFNFVLCVCVAAFDTSASDS